MARRLVTVVVSLVALGLLLPVTAIAQDDPGLLTWIGLIKTKSGKSDQVIGMTMQNDKPMYDRLIAEGKIESWGMAIPINHRVDDAWNHFTWATVKNWAAIGELQQGFQSMFAEMGAEKMKAMGEKFSEATHEGSHADWIVRHLEFKTGESGKASRYFYFGYWTVKPGKNAALEKLYNNVVPKAYAPLIASGAITGYGLLTPELHGEDFTHLAWVSMPDLSGVDAINEALGKTITPEQMQRVNEITVPGSHWDQVLLIIHNSRNPAE